nr:hypothetical protein [Tanacetum cinerariifolium]
MSSLTVSYTSVYSDSEPWRFQWVSDVEKAPQSSKQEPPLPNYVPGLEHPPSPDYVHGSKYPKYLAPANDEIPVEDQPLPTDDSPTALSSTYVADSDLKEDLEEDPADYPADGRNDEDEDESSEADDDGEEEMMCA